MFLFLGASLQLVDLEESAPDNVHKCELRGMGYELAAFISLWRSRQSIHS